MKIKWPDDVKNITLENMSTTDLWVLKEKIDAGIKFEVSEMFNIMLDEEFTVTIDDEQYKFYQYYSVEKIRRK